MPFQNTLEYLEESILIIKRTGDSLTLAIRKDEYLFWFHFCEYYIEQCIQLSKAQPLPDNVLYNIRKAKETLESVMFNVDIFRGDNSCSVSIPLHFLPVLQHMMEQWDQILLKEILIRQEKLKYVTNGENKRQYTDEVERLEKQKVFNSVFIVQFKKYV